MALGMHLLICFNGQLPFFFHCIIKAFQYKQCLDICCEISENMEKNDSPLHGRGCFTNAAKKGWSVIYFEEEVRCVSSKLKLKGSGEVMFGRCV